ncbi:hypothetical protein F9Y90_04840 (plasmid) [Borrelia miyamotoi]|uniref:Uncharacterized protein n=1 Tax=Borrelia miyamotoi TaxID=47466 RepID=A0A5P8AUF5_9SPIR|nr:hypothetical protein [Borrelia miyamotoi]QFP42438.1 hypothetical protein F9Y90_04840 [Borrelia miyamotoi]WAZ72306.1 hypothetical protein O5404_04625 [Borrelia miyamotoi]WVI05302.1 hypothetical protein F9Y91_00270 [Borrelia miyamotoi]
MLKNINNKNTNEEIFEDIKNQLLEPFNHTINFIGITKYKEALRKTLNNTQNKGLDSLKEASNDENMLLHF